MWQTWTQSASTAVVEILEPSGTTAVEVRSHPRSVTSAKSTSTNSAGKALVSILSGRQNLASNLQLTMTVLIPILATIGLCALTLKNEIGSFQTSQSLTQSTIVAQNTGTLVTQLQKERGFTNLYLSTKRFDRFDTKLFHSYLNACNVKASQND